MRKMKLDMDALAVESFEMPGDGVGVRGTIRGNADTRFVCSWQQSCVDTCAQSCGGSCFTGTPCPQVC
jgi:hypothetical protein